MTAQTAAELLGTSPTVLSLWEQRFGYPVPVRSAEGEWVYPDDAMVALRDALGRELSIASAITKARRVQTRTSPPACRLPQPQNS
jgi:hypothetical protein